MSRPATVLVKRRIPEVFFILASAVMIVAASGSKALAADNYAVVYDGAPPDLAEQLPKLTALSLARRPFPTAAAIRYAGVRDVEIVKRALVAAGYYAPQVSFALQGEAAEGDLLVAKFLIEPGPKFRIARHIIVYEDDLGDERPLTFEAAGIPVTEDSAGAALEKNHQRLVASLWASGFPAARIVARRAEARPDERAADAIYVIESGRKSRFGGVVINDGLKTRSDFIEKHRTWDDDEVFDRARLIEYRDDLSDLGVFSAVEIAPGAVDDDGRAPVVVTLEERKPRTVGAGISFSTSEGPGGRLFLEYRNVFGRAERVRADLEATEIRQSMSVDLARPLPGFDALAFANFTFLNETTDAFDARSFLAAGGVRKSFLDDRLELSAGLALETSSVESSLSTGALATDRLYLVSTPLSATWSTEDDPLGLTDGLRATFSVTPYAGTDNFVRFETTARTRRQFGASDRFTIAGRARIAATAGTTLRALPVNKRVYSGGGSSVRGYDYQSVGPLDPNNVPLGGRSAVEAAIEARARVTKQIEVAGFVDAGAVYSERFPDFLGDYLVGAGGGLRYLSPIGPLRLDVAVPIEKRASDRDFQIYVSLGQPF